MIMANFLYSLEVTRKNNKGSRSAHTEPRGSLVVSGDNYFETTVGVRSRLLPHKERNLLGESGVPGTGTVFLKHSPLLC